MANRDRPNGFKPQRALNGGNWTALVRRLPCADVSGGDADDHIFIGDPLTLSSGKAARAVTGNTILGVVVGVGKASATWGEVGPFDPTTLSSGLYVPFSETASDTWYVWYVPADGVLFEVQTASDLDLVVGSEADINIGATGEHGSTTTGISDCELTTNSNSDVMVVEDVRDPENDTTLANARHIVRFRATQNTAAQPTT